MNTFSENGNDFVGRLLHEGGVSRRTFSAFPENQTASTGVGAVICCLILWVFYDADFETDLHHETRPRPGQL